MKQAISNYFKRPTVNSCITPVLGILVILVIGSLLVPGFTTPKSVANYATLSAMTILACIGQFLVIVAGKSSVDLSIGAFISLGAAFGGSLANGTATGLIFALIIMLLVGAVAGLVSGLTVQFLSVPAMVITLSVGSLLDSSYIAVTKGKAASGIPQVLRFLGTESILGIRVLLLLAIAAVVVMEVILRHTNYGKSLYYVGTSEQAATYSGIRSARVVVLAYVFSGITAALAGFVLLGITGSMQAGMGEQYTMLAIASCVIGGISLAGGRGTFVGAAFGAFMLTTLNSLLMVVNIPEGARNCTKGLILLAILLAYGRGPRLRA